MLMLSHSPPQKFHLFDARGVACRFRHRANFSALDALRPGGCVRFINDHDPLPLLEQLRHRFGEKLGIEYRQRETGSITIDFHVLG